MSSLVGLCLRDSLVEIADMALAGMNNEEVATRLRGRAGTSVTLKLRRAAVSVLHRFPFLLQFFLYLVIHV